MFETLAPYLAYTAALFVAAGIPGPGIAALVGRSIGSSTAATLPFIFGLALGDVAFLTLAILGLAVVAQTFAGVFLAIKIAGGLYLLWLAYQFWTAGLDPQQIELRRSAKPLTSIAGGFLVTMGNPKVVVFYMALLPNVIDLTDVSMIKWSVLSLLTVLILFAAMTPYVVLTARATALLKSPRAMRRLNRTAASFIGGAGALILVDAAVETVRERG